MGQKFKILILGSDGFLGFATALHLTKKGYKVFGLDNFLRRRMVEEVGGQSVFPIENRYNLWEFQEGSVMDADTIYEILEKFQPDVIIHFAEQPSAPYSMKSVGHATFTQMNNVIGTLNLLWAMKEKCPKAHLIKIGTMGEYSDWIYRGSKIPEGNRVKVIYNNMEIEIPTPKATGSFYHWSKIFDSGNIEFTCKIWGLKATDINQGVVYGTRIEEMDDNTRTRFDFDECFGTIINRFCAQAIIGIPLTIYGLGFQKRGFINLQNVVQAIELVIEHPPKEGEFRVVNQLTEVFTLNELAEIVKETGDKLGLNVQIQHILNPRVEKERHEYFPTFSRLREFGLQPIKLRHAIRGILEDLIPYKSRIEEKKEAILPKTFWK